MPQRSNEFQKLVHVVRQHIGNAGTVTESKFLKHRLTGDEIEVDVVIEADVNGRSIIIGVECTDTGRNPDRTWVEKMDAKHQYLPTHDLILACSKTPSDGALREAKVRGIDFIVLEEFDAEAATLLFTRMIKMASFTFTPVHVGLTVLTSDGSTREVEGKSDFALYDGIGTYKGPLEKLIRTLSSPQVFRDKIAKSDGTEKGFLVRWDPVRTDKGKTLFTILETETDEYHVVDKIEVTGHFDMSVSEFALRHGKLGEVEIAWGKGEFFGKTSMLVVTKNKLTLRLGEPGKEVSKRARRRNRS